MVKPSALSSYLSYTLQTTCIPINSSTKSNNSFTCLLVYLLTKTINSSTCLLVNSSTKPINPFTRLFRLFKSSAVYLCVFYFSAPKKRQKRRLRRYFTPFREATLGNIPKKANNLQSIISPYQIFFVSLHKYST